MEYRDNCLENEPSGKGKEAPISRRSFLATAAVAGAGALATSQLTACAAGEAEDEVQEEQIFRGVCRPNCFAYCHLNVHVRDGRIVKTSRAPYLDARYSRICHRGMSHVQRVYDPARLQYPIKRVEGTERGAGEWERVSWDEAFTWVADAITQTQTKYGKAAVAIWSASGNQSLVVQNTYTRFRNLIGASAVSHCNDYAIYQAQSRMTGPQSQIFESNEQTDMINAKVIVVWGANITESNVQSWHFVKEAMMAGVKLVVIDPTFTLTASKADYWLPVRPGTDMPLAMGIMYLALERGAQDEAFLKASTVAPFLVRSDTGKFLRWGDVDEAAETPDAYMVLVDGQAVPLTGEESVELSGEYDFEGVSCRTAYDLLVDEIKQFPPSRVCDLCDITEEQLTTIADYCMDTPVTHYVGYGSQAYMNGVHAIHAGMTLCALLGNMGKPGASYGSYWHLYFGSNGAYSNPVGAVSTTLQANDLPAVAKLQKLGDQDFAFKMLYIHTTNPLCSNGDTNLMINDLIGNLDYFVVADSTVTDTAQYADLVLPIAQWFEVFDASSAGQCSTIGLNEKAIDPLYESKADTDIIRGIAGKLGLGEYFNFTDEEAMKQILDSALGKIYGISFEKLQEDKEFRFSFDSPHIAWRGGTGFSTPSKRLEFYLENPAVRAKTNKVLTQEIIDREHLPHWFKPAEVWHEDLTTGEYPFQLMSERPRYRVHSQWYSVPLLREIDPEPILKINPKDGEKTGLSDGAMVEAYNSRGHAVARLMYSNAVRPGTLVYPKGWQRKQHIAGGWSELFSSDYDVVGVSQNWMDTACNIKAWNNEGRTN